MNSILSFSASRLGAISLGLMLVLSFHGNAAAQWKWKDDSGRVQYSDLPPPPSVKEEKILQRPHGAQRRVPTFASDPAASGAAAPAAAASLPKVDPELEAKRNKQKDEEAAKRKAEEERVAVAKSESCARATRYVASLKEGRRIGRTNDKGEREVLDDNQRAAEISRAEGVAATNCK
jgi:hypothetical protein